MADIARLELALRNADAAGDEEAARALAQALIEARKAQPTQPAPSTAESIATGLADPIHGGAQLLTKALPDSVVAAGNRVNNWLADKTGIVAKLPDGGVDAAVRKRESEYTARRGPDAGIDWARLVGNIFSPVNLALGGAAGATSGAARSAALGAAAAATAPVASDEFWSEKGAQVGTGAALGALTPAVVRGVSRVISPRASTNPNLATLRQEGVRPTIGQTLGGMANRVEEKATSLPVVGDAIRDARYRAVEDLNVAAANRALAPIGRRVPPNTTGRELVQKVNEELGNAYNSLLPKMTAKADDAFNAEIQSLRELVATGSIDPKAAAAFGRIMRNDVLGKFRGQRVLTGKTLKDVESDLGAHIARFGASTDADDRLVANALTEARDSLRSLLVRNNPRHAARLQAINKGWANYKRLESAASRVGAEDGVFTAAQLQSAVRALDRSKDKRAFATGTALMQDLSDPAKSILGSKVPDSGTAGRLLNTPNILTAAGAAVLDPLLLAPMIAGYGAYTAPMQNVLRGAVTARPTLAQPVAGALNRAAPMLAPAGGLLGVEMIN